MGRPPKMNRMNLKLLASTLCLCTALPAPATPQIQIARESEGLAITFTGTLEAASQVAGPWSEITNTEGVFHDDGSQGRRFFRTREEGGSIFSSASVVNWTVTGPFQTNFNLAFAGTPDGIFPPNRQKPYFNAEFKMGPLTLPVTMRVRGNSSLQECSFPKLKMKVSKEDRANTPFADAREIKIGTHCAEGGHGNIGRLRDERAAWREALAYEAMQTLGFVSPRIRRAIIQYHDTGTPDELANTGWIITRHAFIADDIELIADRLGGRALKDEEVAALKKTPFAPQLVTDLELLHALLGNWDFSLEAESRGLWNTEVVELADKTLLPVAGDFDLASWVTETVRLSTPSEYHPELPSVERQVLFTLEGLQARAGMERFNNGAQRFLGHKSAIEGKVNTAEIDAPGRTNVLQHVSAFYNALNSLLEAQGE